MKKQLFFLLVLIPFFARSQDLIKTKEGVDIPCRLQSATPQLVKYINSNNLQSDSIITENVVELVYKDTLRVFVYPASERLKVDLIDEASYKLLFGTKDYGKILHTKTILSDVAFIGNTDNLTLDSKKKLTVSLATYKTNKDIYWEVSAHTDTVGKVAINLAQSQARATAFRNYMEVQGFEFSHLTPIGKGESEPLFFKTGETIKNKRVELRATKIDKVGMLYWETYIPPKIVVVEKPVVYESPTPVIERNTEGQVVIKDQKIRKKANASSSENYGFAFLISFSGVKNLNKTWKSDKLGIGLDNTVGVNTDLVFRGKKIGVSVGVGYYSWLLTRNFLYLDEKLYTATEKFTDLPLSLGVRLYVTKNVYLMPNAGYNILRFKSDTDDTHPFPKLNQTDNTNTLSFGLSAGFEKRFSQVLAQVSLKYQYYNIQKSPSSINTLLNEPISFVGFNLGLGFCK